jgi:adenosylmethionine-8-amino-7-oxononanoate aminotransferase
MYAPILSTHAHHVPTPQYRHRALPAETEEAYSARLAADLEAKILEIGSERVMAFAAETIVGAAAGVMTPSKGYFPAISAVLRKYGILLIADEVMSGAGRCGEFFAWQAVCEGIKPDIVAVAKGLGAGYMPLAGIIATEEVVDVIKKGGEGIWNNSHTYQGHPVACAVGVKVVEVMDREGLLSNVRQRGAQLISELQAAFKGVESMVDVRGKGLVRDLLAGADTR